ncbi:STAS domain-containing protein [Nocardia sp. NPDC058058]|uniref:STAS domain-containing protein n=1 Tax=Nocardia sp. NPDC058058 TaxID=3346317 RepID=UPI0036D7C7EE
MSTDFTVTQHTGPAGPVLTFTGELDAASSPTAFEAIRALKLVAAQLLLLDLTALGFCDSSGITAFLAARNSAEDADAAMALVGIPDQLARIFSLIGLDSIFTMYATVAEAHTAWTAAGSAAAD